MASRATKRAKRPRKPGSMFEIVEFGHADRLAKALLGPQGAARYMPRANKYRYTVGQAFVYEGRKIYGLVGRGKTWQEALDEAEARLEAHRSKEQQE